MLSKHSSSEFTPACFQNILLQFTPAAQLPRILFLLFLHLITHIMKNFLLSAIVLLAPTSFPFYITDPYTSGKNSYWSTGQKATVSWNNNNVDVAACKFLVLDLMFGDSSAAKGIRNIGNKVAATSTSVTWTVSSDLPFSDKYFVRIVCVKENPGQFYSSRFTINGNRGDPKNLVPATFVPGTADDPSVCPECEGRISAENESNKISVLSTLLLLASTISGILLLL